MRRVHLQHVLYCAMTGFSLAFVPSPLMARDQNRAASQQTVGNLSTDQGIISAEGNIVTISIDVLRPTQFAAKNGDFIVSFEIPKDAVLLPLSQMRPFTASSTETTNPTAVTALENPVQEFQVTFPPGPDLSTRWVTVKGAVATNSLSPIVRAAIKVATQRPFSFSRILIGVPSTPNSRVVGAYSSSASPSTSNGKNSRGPSSIRAGVDYLGTISARQHFRIPAGTLGPETAAFDEMVEFGEAPLEPNVSHADTVMIRLQNVRPGGTTPVRLVAFANKSVNPIRIKRPQGDLQYNVLAQLSPNAESGGFITINGDGTYQSTTTLTPLLTFQRVENGAAVGDPIVVDAATTPIPGFPFYLASQGGKWRATRPNGRFAPATTSNFFYATPDNVNTFVHSNGLALGVNAACAKSSVQTP